MSWKPISSMLFLLLAPGAPAAEVTEPHFDLAQEVVATYPFPEVQNRIYYAVRARKSRELRPVRRCVLVHGYGVSESLLGFLFQGKGFGARVVRISVQLQAKSMALAFGEFTWGGPHLIETLAEQACDEVVIAAQETSQRSIEEIVLTTEAFLKAKACPPGLSRAHDRQKTCALIGHSLGGAVVTAIAQRCRDKRGMSQEVCAGIAEVYSASGAIGGSTFSAVLAGAFESQDRALSESFLSTIKLGTEIATPYASGGPAYEYGYTQWLDLFSDQIDGRTNPAWYSLSPLAEIAGRPVWLERAKDLRKGGYFSGQYAASATGFEYGRETGAPGCGTPWYKDPAILGHVEGNPDQFHNPRARALAEILASYRSHRRQPTGDRQRLEEICQAFSQASSLVHGEHAKSYFKNGAARLTRLFGQRHGGIPPSLTERLTWEEHQISDGLVEKAAALSVCANTHPRALPDDTNSNCRLFRGGDALNHLGLAGFSSEMVSHLVEKLRD